MGNLPTHISMVLHYSQMATNVPQFLVGNPLRICKVCVIFWGLVLKWDSPIALPFKYYY